MTVEAVPMNEEGNSPTDACPPPRKVRGPNKERRDLTRIRLLEAAVGCLFELGYAATTTTRVVERAGYTRGAILHHFPTKVDLMLETALHIIDSQNAFRASLRDTVAPAREQLEQYVDVMWASWDRPHAFALLEIMMGVRGDPELAERFPKIKRQIEGNQRDGFWRLAQAAGIRDREAVDALAVYSVATMRGLAIERIFRPDPKAFAGAFEIFKTARQLYIDRLIDAT